ncbi:hypothetical protein EVAR_49434_1 [Eumeta japonica]|uniref:Uncharacterized protein n=1 Tax=Eumeta variegata TaxID=151549 RepID=A0A4C1YZH8_EUMVA|nr:hypothetical protein EVAR_49434_1 [Eumeta japonica]
MEEGVEKKGACGEAYKSNGERAVRTLQRGAYSTREVYGAANTHPPPLKRTWKKLDGEPFISARGLAFADGLEELCHKCNK